MEIDVWNLMAKCVSGNNSSEEYSNLKILIAQNPEYGSTYQEMKCVFESSKPNTTKSFKNLLSRIESDCS